MIFEIALAMVATGLSHGQTVYLDCFSKQVPEIAVRDLYLTPPISQEAFAEDIWRAGLVRAVLPPDNTWVVDRKAGTVTSPDSSFPAGYLLDVITEAEVLASFVSESGNVSTWHLNRVNGVVSTVLIIQDDTPNEWQADHGKPFPRVWEWKQQCAASDEPRM